MHWLELFPGKRDLNLDIWSPVFGRKLGWWECGKKAAPFVNSRKWDFTKRRFVNSAFKGEQQKGDMQGPLGQLDSQQNEIILPFACCSWKSFTKLQNISRRIYWSCWKFSGDLKLYVGYGWPHSCMKLSRLIGSAMLQPFNSDMKWWQGLNIQVTRTWVARIRSMRTAPRMPKLHCRV